MTRGSGKINDKKGVIFDIDGTLMQDGKAIAKSVETLELVRSRGWKIRFLTNMTGRTPQQIAQSLNKEGILATSDEIHTSVTSCVKFLEKKSKPRCFFAIPENTSTMFESFKHTEEQPDYVVLGDIESSFNYDLMNKVFRYINAGSQLVVFHRNMYFVRGEKYWLDTGAFTVALEKATDKDALVTGKPSRAFFQSAIESLRLRPEEVIVIGDDVTSDILGARNVGAFSILIGSGKFHPRHLQGGYPQADLFVDSIDKIPDILLQINEQEYAP